ncbi:MULTISPECIES: hypothetical protein, partial [unclassified Endozoicomonas]|uniref:hypothetical protein n=1 Tax=unclassified Endozoicomonas TaxID=2644528 RepID=UPI002147CB26
MHNSFSLNSVSAFNTVQKYKKYLLPKNMPGITAGTTKNFLKFTPYSSKGMQTFGADQPLKNPEKAVLTGKMQNHI